MHQCKTLVFILPAAIIGGFIGVVKAVTDGYVVEMAVPCTRITPKADTTKIGLAFQITDDVLDKVGTVEQLGKNPGADEACGKVTFLSFMSVDEAKAEAENLTAEATDAISDIEGAGLLISLARELVKRSF